MDDPKRDAFKQVLVHLIAAVSLLDRADKMKKAPRYAVAAQPVPSQPVQMSG